MLSKECSQPAGLLLRRSRLGFLSLFLGLLVRRLVGSDRSAVADIVQETFVAAARSARSYDAGRGPLAQWLLGIAHHHVAQYWKTTARHSALPRLIQTGLVPSRLVLASGPGEAGLTEADDPARLLEQSESAELVRRVLSELPAEAALVLCGKYLDNLSVEDLVARDGGTIESVRSRLARARRDFRERYERLARWDEVAADPKPRHPPSEDAS